MRRSSSAPLIHRRSAVPPVRRCPSAPVGGALAPERPRPPLKRPRKHCPPPVPPLRLRPPLCSAAPAAAAARAASRLPLGPNGCSRQPGGLLLLGCSPSHRARSAPSRRRSCARRHSRAPLRPCPPVPLCAALSGGRARPPSDAKRQNGLYLLRKPRPNTGLRKSTVLYRCRPFWGGGALKLLPLSPASASRTASNPLRRGRRDAGALPPPPPRSPLGRGDRLSLSPPGIACVVLWLRQGRGLRRA